MVKDASVVHPRRAEWSQVLSIVLNMLVSSGTGPLSLQTPAAGDLIPTGGKTREMKLSYCRKKGPRLHAVLEIMLAEKTREPKPPERCRYCFGGVLAGGLAAGFAGLGAGALAAGAATPEATL
jgi:hypothetical protein